MPTQIAKLDFWSYLTYKPTSDLTSLNGGDASKIAQIKNIISKQSGNILKTDAAEFTADFGMRHYVKGSIPVMTDGAETFYLKSGSYIAGYFIPSATQRTGSIEVDTGGVSAINSAKGFELHWCEYSANVSGTAATQTGFTIGSVNYRLEWSTNGGLKLLTSAGADLSLTVSATDNATDATWREMKLRVFRDGTNIYVQANGIQGAKNIYGYKSIPNTGTQFSLIFLSGRSGAVFNRLDNVSLYTISETERNAYDDDISVNTLAPFQRYAPMIDIVPVFGTDWTGNDDTAFADITDGDLTTFATTDTLDAPIGYVASNGVATNSIVSGEWYMVIAGGVGEDFSSVGGPASAVLNDVFLATSAGTIGTNSVYLLLTMGDILGRCYAWTPGTLTQLPTVGLVRSGGSMAFSVANTDVETTRFKFGTPEDGDNVSAFNYVQADVETTGNPFGETLAVSYFDDGAGEFTDGTNTHTFTTSQPVIFTLERKS